MESFMLFKNQDIFNLINHRFALYGIPLIFWELTRWHSISQSAMQHNFTNSSYIFIVSVLLSLIVSFQSAL